LPYTPIPGTPDYEKYKHIDLEDLNPALYPCAHEKMRAEDLEKFYAANRNVNYCLRGWNEVKREMAPSEKRMVESSPVIIKKKEV
jgi:hypothetical protein